MQPGLDVTAVEVVRCPIFKDWYNQDPGRYARVVVNDVGMRGGKIRNLHVTTYGQGDPERFILRGPTVDVLVVVGNGEGREKIALVGQYRSALHRWILSNPAGDIEPGEEPEEAAEREVREELGLDDRIKIRLSWLIPTPTAVSPGSINELAYFMRADIDIEPDHYDRFVASLDGRRAGVAEEGEETVVRMMDPDEVFDLCFAAGVVDGKLVQSLAYSRMKR